MTLVKWDIVTGSLFGFYVLVQGITDKLPALQTITGAFISGTLFMLLNWILVRGQRSQINVFDDIEGDIK